MNPQLTSQLARSRTQELQRPAPRTRATILTALRIRRPD
jgi:transcription elongation factor